MRLIPFILLGTILACTSQTQKSDGPVKIIFDTDMGPDYDDVGAIAVLHALANKGECKILATVSSNRFPTAAPTIAVFNNYFKKTDIPIGIPEKGAPNFSAQNHWTDSIVNWYLPEEKRTWKYPSAVEVYRKVLADEKDQSVTIVTVGFISNIAGLLKSKPDQYSSLSGYELVKSKVKNWVAMAGKFPDGKEFNVIKDWEASKYAFDHWPTPIVFSGFEIGDKIFTGKKLASEGSKDNPLSLAYRYNLKTYKNEVKEKRQSFDQTAVLCAVRNPEKYFYVNGPGKFLTLENGQNIWDPDTNANHYFLSHKYPYQHIADVIDDLMMNEPQK